MTERSVSFAPAILVALCFLPATLFAAYDEDVDAGGFGDSFVERPGWCPEPVKIPGYPKEDNLVELDLRVPSLPFRVFLDRTALSAHRDGTVRYTLVLRSPEGVDNVRYELLRCAKNRVRVYATGNARVRMVEVGDGRWKPIREVGLGRYHALLKRYYLCDAGVPLSPREVLARIRQGAPEDLDQ